MIEDLSNLGSDRKISRDAGKRVPKSELRKKPKEGRDRGSKIRARTIREKSEYGNSRFNTTKSILKTEEDSAEVPEEVEVLFVLGTRCLAWRIGVGGRA